MKTIAFITTCKGRLHHLRETLPLLAAQGASEVILVDFDCPDRVGDWAEAELPGVKVVRASNEPDFITSRARNLGAAAATAEWLVFIDGDVKVASGWIDWMQANLQPGHFYQVGAVNGLFDGDAQGTAICRRSDFAKAGGYDEVMRGWGGDDSDFYFRLSFEGVARAFYPGEFVTPIRHGHDARAGWDGMRDIEHKTILNHCYISLKMHVMTMQRDQLPLDQRLSLMAQVRDTVTKWAAGGSDKPLAVHYTVPRMKQTQITRNYAVGTDLTFTINVRPSAEERA